MAERNDPILEIQYEKDGKLLYRYNIDFRKIREHIYFLYNGKKHKVSESFDTGNGGFVEKNSKNYYSTK